VAPVPHLGLGLGGGGRIGAGCDLGFVLAWSANCTPRTIPGRSGDLARDHGKTGVGLLSPDESVGCNHSFVPLLLIFPDHDRAGFEAAGAWAIGFATARERVSYASLFRKMIRTIAIDFDTISIRSKSDGPH
jgi:hypothetical protein